MAIDITNIVLMALQMNKNKNIHNNVSNLVFFLFQYD